MSKQFQFKTEKFPKSIKGGDMLSENNYHVLVECGLPRWVAPHLYFGDFEDIFLPKLKDWSGLSDWDGSMRELFDEYQDCRVIGSSDEQAPIFLKPMEEGIYTFIPDIDEAVIVNTNIENLLQTLDEYAIMIEIAFLKNKKFTKIY